MQTEEVTEGGDQPTFAQARTFGKGVFVGVILGSIATSLLLPSTYVSQGSVGDPAVGVQLPWWMNVAPIALLAIMLYLGVFKGYFPPRV